MATSHLHRIIVVVPVAKVAAVAGWLNTNIRAAFVPDDLGPALNATGNAADPVACRWANFAARDGECRQILVRLCQLASVTPPTQQTWNGWTRAEKLSWLTGVRASVLSGYGVLVTLAMNDGQWSDPVAALAELGLQPVRPDAPT